MKGEHFKKACVFKNWKSGKLIKANSLKEIAKRYKIPYQVVSDINTGRRKFFGQLCLPTFNYNTLFKYKIKNLLDNKVYKFKYKKEALEKFSIHTNQLNRLCNNNNYRYKNFCHVKFKNIEKIPIIKNNITGEENIIYSMSDYKNLETDLTYKQFNYLLNNKRIASSHDIQIKNYKNYKYIIKDKDTNELFKVLTLKNFAKNKGINFYNLYIRNKKCKYEVIEG